MSTIRDRLLPKLKQRQHSIQQQQERARHDAAHELLGMLSDERVEEELQDYMEEYGGYVASYVITLSDDQNWAARNHPGIKQRLYELEREGLSVKTDQESISITLQPDDRDDYHPFEPGGR